jgi:hypothetical protein
MVGLGTAFYNGKTSFYSGDRLKQRRKEDTLFFAVATVGHDLLKSLESIAVIAPFVVYFIVGVMVETDSIGDSIRDLNVVSLFDMLRLSWLLGNLAPIIVKVRTVTSHQLRMIYYILLYFIYPIWVCSCWPCYRDGFDAPNPSTGGK